MKIKFINTTRMQTATLALVAVAAAATTAILPFVAQGAPAVPVTPAKNQQQLLLSTNPKLAKNKRLAFDFFRLILIGRRVEQIDGLMRDDYIQHNPNVETGKRGFLDYLSKKGSGPRPVPSDVPGLVSIQAEGDYVTMSFVDERSTKAIPGEKYTTTWFDMFRIENGHIAEHWDNALIE